MCVCVLIQKSGIPHIDMLKLNRKIKYSKAGNGNYTLHTFFCFLGFTQWCSVLTLQSGIISGDSQNAIWNDNKITQVGDVQDKESIHCTMALSSTPHSFLTNLPLFSIYSTLNYRKCKLALRVLFGTGSNKKKWRKKLMHNINELQCR